MKQLSIITTCILISLSSLAQPHDGPPPKPDAETLQRVKALKISFITTELRLSPEEAQVFWPVYNQYEEEKRAIHKEFDVTRGRVKPGERPSDDELSKLMNQKLEMDKKKIALQEKYISEFKNVLPEPKVAKLFFAEEQFKKKLIEQIRRDRDGGERSDHPRKPGGFGPR